MIRCLDGNLSHMSSRQLNNTESLTSHFLGSQPMSFQTVLDLLYDILCIDCFYNFHTTLHNIVSCQPMIPLHYHWLSKVKFRKYCCARIALSCTNGFGYEHTYLEFYTPRVIMLETLKKCRKILNQLYHIICNIHVQIGFVKVGIKGVLPAGWWSIVVS